MFCAILYSLTIDVSAVTSSTIRREVSGHTFAVFLVITEGITSTLRCIFGQTVIATG